MIDPLLHVSALNPGIRDTLVECIGQLNGDILSIDYNKNSYNHFKLLLLLASGPDFFGS